MLPAGEHRVARPLLVPRLGPSPSGAALAYVPALLLSAMLLLYPLSIVPGRWLAGMGELPDGPGTLNYHWLVHGRGLLASSWSRMLAYPAGVDRLVVDGFPLDALASQPFCALLGWPLGFNVYLVMLLWLLGVGIAWLAARWWRSSAAALVAGATMQSAGIISLEIAEGRSTQVFAALFLVAAVGLTVQGLERRRALPMVLAGVCWGLGALSYWFMGWFAGLALMVLLLLAWLEGRPVGRLALALLGGCLLVVAVPLAYTVLLIERQPGSSAGPWSLVVHRGQVGSLARLVESRALRGIDLVSGHHRVRIVVLVLGCVALVGTRLRRVTAPLAWLVIGGWTAMGVWTLDSEALAIPGPFALTLHLPFLSRLWWPERGLLLLAPGAALLAGGGAALVARKLRMELAVGGLLTVAVLAEVIGLGSLWPMPVVSSAMRPEAEIVAAGSGPALVLPLPSGPLGEDSMALYDQTFHGRPLLNWTTVPSTSTAPAAYRRLGLVPVIAGLELCEADILDPRVQDVVDGVAQLQALGLRQVYLHLTPIEELGPRGQAYVACVRGLLMSEGELVEPYLVFDLTGAAAPTASSAPALPLPTEGIDPPPAAATPAAATVLGLDPVPPAP